MIRPTKARAPYVGISNISSDAFTVSVSGADTTPGYLNDKITTGDGLTTAIENAGGDEDLLISLTGAAHPYAVEGMGFYDDFLQSKPFWGNTQVITSGDWSIDTVNNWMLGLAQNNAQDIYRSGIEGDFDHSIKIGIESATSCGFVFTGLDNSGAAITVEYKFTSGGDYIITCTGETPPATIPRLGATQWLRLERIGSTINFYDRLNDTDDWNLVHSFTGVDLGYNVTAKLDSATSGKIYFARFIDNVSPETFRGYGKRRVSLTDAASITVDARKGNIFSVTLGGNRIMSNPLYPHEEQMIIFRIKQDGTGGRTISWDTKYRFSTDLPSPTLSTGSGKLDYLGFIYNSVDDKWDYISEVKGF